MNDGRTIGARTDAQAQLWLNPQTWAIIAGVADEARAQSSMQAVNEQLASPYGLHLFAEPYQGYEEDIPDEIVIPLASKKMPVSSATPIPGR